jgi:co-chaperonin GroES (HSP10)
MRQLKRDLMAKNKCGITPVGTVLVILPDPVEETSESGIVLTTASESDRLKLAQTDGVVIAIAPDAFTDLGESKPRCKVGDRVIFAKYAGMIRKGNDDVEYRLIHDRDVLAVLGDNK